MAASPQMLWAGHLHVIPHKEAMPFPDDLRSWLASNRHEGYASSLAGRTSEVASHLAEFGIPETSELGEFYLLHGPFTVRGWYALNEIDEVVAATQLAWEYGAPSKYIALTSFEGDGVTLYDRNAGAVYDVERGQFGALERGELKPIAKSFGDFLRWCKERE